MVAWGEEGMSVSIDCGQWSKYQYLLSQVFESSQLSKDFCGKIRTYAGCGYISVHQLNINWVTIPKKN